MVNVRAVRILLECILIYLIDCLNSRTRIPSSKLSKYWYKGNRRFYNISHTFHNNRFFFINDEMSVMHAADTMRYLVNVRVLVLVRILLECILIYLIDCLNSRTRIPSSKCIKILVQGKLRFSIQVTIS